MNDAYAVDVEEASKSFGSFKALNGVTLRVRKGEIYGLLGPNGAGKTTLIRLICGLVEAHGGTVTVLGRRMPDIAVLRHIGYMTQQADHTRDRLGRDLLGLGRQAADLEEQRAHQADAAGDGAIRRAR